MEESITSSDFVIIICTPEYADKANTRKDGVGYEAMIITSEIAKNILKNKFIPILRAGNWNTSLPRWLEDKRGADLRETPYSKEEYQDLLRTLHQHQTAPPIGTPPLPSDIRIGPSKRAQIRQVFPFGVKEDLKPKEVELIVNAANDQYGQISYRQFIGGEHLFTNNKQLLESRNPRARAEWFDALDRLEIRGLIRPLNTDRSLFEVTGTGYEQAEDLSDFARWTTKQITLTAYYILNPADDTITLSCTNILRLPAQYFPGKTGADGSIMWSEREPRSLLIEGVNLETIESLKWTPNHVSFKDDITGEEQDFHVHDITTKKPNALKLSIAR